MELDMVADMEVDKLADKVAEMMADNKKMIINIDITMEIQFGELVTGVGLLGPDFFDPKLTRLAHLLSFASLFTL